MIKAILWKIFFELENLRWLLTHSFSKKTVYYFAYGANLDPETLDERFIRPLSSQPFVLQNHALQFSHTGPYKGMGFACAESSPGNVVYGKLYELTEADGRRMDFHEAVPVLKRHKKVTFTQSGITAFFYQSARPLRGLKPTVDYLECILDGFQSLPNVPKSYIEALSRTETLKEKYPADDIGFAYRTQPWMPEWLKKQVRLLDTWTLRFYANVLREYSLTEGLVQRAFQLKPPGSR